MPLPTDKHLSEGLAECMQVFANPVRLQVLQALRHPLPLSEIRVRPHRRQEGLSQQRFVARQTVREHLDRLLAFGVVDALHNSDGGAPRYQLNHARVFGIMEDLRTIATVRAVQAPPLGRTRTMHADQQAVAPATPHLSLVHGVHEGTRYELQGDQSEWRIGRTATDAVRLDYDPYVSKHHATINRGNRGFSIVDAGAKNPATVNWVPLEPGGSHPMRAGDVLGIGRSRLVFVTP